MAGFEIIVRPVVFPDIRPAPARSLPPQDDPEQGFAVIRGNGGKHIDLSYSYSAQASCSRPVETKRRVDDVRVYQVDDNGEVNNDNFVDLQVANKIWTEGGGATDSGGNDSSITGGSHPPKGNSTEIATWYARQLEALGVEIMKRDSIVKNEER